MPIPSNIGEFPQGIDVSHHQGVIDWAKVAGSGVVFTFIKATEGNDFVDKKFATNRAGAKANNILCGPYHYYTPGDDPIAQADHFIATVEALHPGELQPVLDIEENGNERPSDLVNNVEKWIERVRAGLHRDPIIYTYIWFWMHAMQNTSQFSRNYPLWIAHYTSEQKPTLVGSWPRWSFWQYTSTGSVPGIGGHNVDQDCFNGSVANLRKFAGL